MSEGFARARIQLLRGSVLVVVSTSLWQATNFAYNAIGAHLLGPSSYGSLAATTALLAVFTPVFVAIQTIASRIATTKASTGAQDELRGLLAYYGSRLLVGGVFAGVLIVLLSSAVARALRMQSHWPVAVLGGVVALSTITHLQRGVLQGMRSFGRYATSTTVEAAAKLIFTLVFVMVVSKTVTSAVAGLVLASGIGLLANTLLLRFLPHPHRHTKPVDHPFRYSLLTLAALVGLALLLADDVVAAKRYLPAHQAGVYAAVSLGGKIAFYGSSAITTLLFPFFSAQHDEGSQSRRLLWIAGGIVAAGGGLLVVVYAAVPGLLVRPLFGSHFDAAKPHLALAGGIFGLYALAYLAALYLLARHDGRGLVLIWFSVLAQLAALGVLHSSIDRILVAQLIATALLVVSLGSLVAFFPPRSAAAVVEPA